MTFRIKLVRVDSELFLKSTVGLLYAHSGLFKKSVLPYRPEVYKHRLFLILGRLLFMIDLDKLTALIRKFNDEREWAQYHSPKNLASSLVIEAAELLEIFQWLTEEESADLNNEKRSKVEEEIGDVLIYLLNLADKLGIDPTEVAMRKLKANAKKYPVEKARGSAAKYTEL